MSNRNNMIPIPGRLHSVAEGEPVSGADEVLDDALNMEQSEINQLTVGTKNASTGTTGAYPYNGMGRVVLHKNMVNGVNTLTQDMLYKGDPGSRVPNTNTIFVIQYDFTLGEDITVPENCVLEFDGGSLKGNTIIGNHTKIIAGDYQIFKKGLYRYRGYAPVGTTADFRVVSSVIGDNININGTWDNDFVSSAWIGLDTISEQEDAAPLIMDYIKLHKGGIKIDLPKRTYGIYGQVDVNGRVFDGNNSIFNYCHLSDMYDASIPIPEDTVALDPTYFPYGLPLTYQNIYVRGIGGELRNFTIDQSNITTADINLNGHWGIYGLCGKRGAAKNIIRNVTIRNAYECCFIGIQGETEFIDCVFNGSGEHEVYGRPEGGNVTFTNCKFTNWENIQEIATSRGVALAVKLVPSPARTNNTDVRFIDCEFVKGSSYSTKVVNVNGDNVYFIDCNTDLEACTLGDSNDTNRTKHLYIDGCDGIFCSYQQLYFIIHVNNSRGTTDILQSVYELSNCVLSCGYTSSQNIRDAAPSNIQDYARKLKITNTTFVNYKDSNIKMQIFGAFDVLFSNVNVITTSNPLLKDIFNLTLYTNTDDTEITGVDPSLVIENSNFLFGKRNNFVFSAKNYDVQLIDTIFKGGKYNTSGYLNRLVIFSFYKSLEIINTNVLPDKDGTTLNLYSGDGSTVTYVRPVPAGQNPSSNIGMQSFDYVSKKPIWWNGTAWVDATGTPV